MARTPNERPRGGKPEKEKEDDASDAEDPEGAYGGGDHFG